MCATMSREVNIHFFPNMIILNVGEVEKQSEFLHIADKAANSKQPGKWFVGFIHCESVVPFLSLYSKRNRTVWSHRVSTGTLFVNESSTAGWKIAYIHIRECSEVIEKEQYNGRFLKVLG